MKVCISRCSKEVVQTLVTHNPESPPDKGQSYPCTIALCSGAGQLGAGTVQPGAGTPPPPSIEVVVFKTTTIHCSIVM